MYDIFFGLHQVAFLLICYAQGYAGVGELGCYLQAAAQQLYALVEVDEVHIAEAQFVEKIWII